jgi:recombination protein RecT
MPTKEVTKEKPAATKPADTAVQKTPEPTSTEVAKKELSQSERFTQMVMKQFTNQAGELELTNFQKKLCQNYFIKIDSTLKDLERKRLAKRSNQEPLEFAWKNVNMEKLAVDVVSFSSVGLDPAQSNHINCIPYKNTSNQTYDITFIEGYRGKEVKALKYGLDIPDAVIVELVFANDKFKQIKKDLNNRVESYSFEVVEDFNRGELMGGFYYHAFKDNPEKNKLRVFSKADIEKRKPAYAAPEFWGGEKDEWAGGSKTGNKIKVEGWYEEMAYKTIYRAAYGSITIDAQKIDDHYRAVLEKEKEPIEARVFEEIKLNANNGEVLSITQDATVTNDPQPVYTKHETVNEATVDVEFEETATNQPKPNPGF